MALSDLVLKAKVNHALTGRPELAGQNIDVRVEDGFVTLTSETDDPDALRIGEDIARRVEGVTGVRTETTPQTHPIAASAEEVRERFLNKLEVEWERLPDNTALTQADYIRWALWMTTKFHIPANLNAPNGGQIVMETIEEALNQIAARVNLPKALLALEMLRQAQAIAESPWRDAPETGMPELASSPASTLEEAAYSSHTSRAAVV